MADLRANRGPAEVDDLVGRLRAVGCVFAEHEAHEIRRLLDDPVAIDAVVTARSHGRPLEQVLGRTRFGGVEVTVQDGVFVPRRRAARLVSAARRVARTAGVAVDLGCGSGALAAALTRTLPTARVLACDVDPVALRCARSNAATYGFTVHEGSWWDALPSELRGYVDVAVAYLPHVPTQQLAYIPRDYREHEPALAVDGGLDGLEPLRTVVAGLDEWLAPHGVFLTLLSAEQLDFAVAIAGGRRVEVVPGDDDDVVLVVRAGQRRIGSQDSGTT